MSTFAGALEPDSDLRSIDTRIGTGEVRYTRIEFLGPDRKPQDLFRCGDSFVVRLYYHAEKRIRNPHFGLELYTETGTLITSLNTWNVGFETPFLPPGEGCIELEVASLNLMPGRYLISLWLDGIRVHYDRLDYCAKLDVEASDYYGTGRGMDRRIWGIVIVPRTWKLSGSG